MQLGKDVYAGLMFAAVAVFYGVVALRTLTIGQALNMGPGYFPVMLSGLLAILGIAIAARGLVASEPVSLKQVPWRAVVVIPAAIVAFGVFLPRIGLFPAVLLTGFMAGLASAQINPLRALLMGALISAFCTLVFGYGVGLPTPVIGPWLTFRI